LNLKFKKNIVAIETIEPNHMKVSPILLFTYKRLDTLIRTVAALKENTLAKDSDLYIFSDGPKNKNDTKKVREIRQFLKSIDGFKSVTIKESEENKGLATSIIGGVSEVIEFSETVIVLEDDLITTPNFLSYMNSALNQYRTAQQVFSISGYSFDFGLQSEAQEETYFLNRGWSWGWATWKNRWIPIDWEVKDYDAFKKNKQLRKKFAQGGSDVNKMLKRQMEGSLDSWAIRWFYHQFKVDGLTLFPMYSKVFNDGFDANATHTTGSNKRYLPLLDQKHSSNVIFPNEIAIESRYRKLFLKRMGIKARIYGKLETLFVKTFLNR